MPTPHLKLDYANPKSRPDPRTRQLDDAAAYILYVFGALAAAGVLFALGWSIVRIVH
jgi:hypothetical protein